ncbi:hypothetical protein A2U01_0055326, partial [Trifolium medium]|nr:hypothetical protein [Trifolium medium]
IPGGDELPKWTKRSIPCDSPTPIGMGDEIPSFSKTPIEKCDDGLPVSLWIIKDESTSPSPTEPINGRTSRSPIFGEKFKRQAALGDDGTNDFLWFGGITLILFILTGGIILIVVSGGKSEKKEEKDDGEDLRERALEGKRNG